MPGTLVFIGVNGLRNSLGASGLGSHVSKWLQPPRNQTKIIAVGSPAALSDLSNAEPAADAISLA